jgi:hypothetical protein
MWWVTPPVDVDMQENSSIDQRLPRVVVAVAAAMAAVYAPNIWLKGLLAGVAATVSATVVFGSTGLGRGAERPEDALPHWRTLKTYRVEA